MHDNYLNSSLHFIWECFTALNIQCTSEFHMFFTYKRVCIADMDYSQNNFVFFKIYFVLEIESFGD